MESFFRHRLAVGLRRPFYQAILGGLAVTVFLYHIAPADIWDLFSVLVSLYLITFLQRMLEARGQITLAQQDLNGIFHNRRVNAAGAPLFIGLLPSAAAMILCGDIVKDYTQGYLDRKEQAFVASWSRHIPKSTLPTYFGVLLMSALSGVPLPKFMLGMIMPLVALVLLGTIRTSEGCQKKRAAGKAAAACARLLLCFGIYGRCS